MNANMLLDLAPARDPDSVRPARLHTPKNNYRFGDVVEQAD
jgi:hypothetical protein